MAFSGQQRSFTLQAAADLSGFQYCAVRLSAAGKTNLASLNTDSSVVGVLQNKPQNNENATISYGGLSKVVAGGTLTAGDIITVYGSGRAIIVTSALIAIGRCLETAAAGNIFSALLFPPVRWTGAA